MKKRAPQKEHYSVYIALILSLITTFALGLLLTEVLFNTGLRYFANLRNEIILQKAYAQMVNPPDCEDLWNECMKKCNPLPPGQYQDCALRCDYGYYTCLDDKVTPPSDNPPTGNGGGTSQMRGGIFFDIPDIPGDCDPLNDPLCNIKGGIRGVY